MLESSLNTTQLIPLSGVIETELGDAVREPVAQLTVFRRSLPRELICWLEALPVKRLPSLRILTRAANLPHVLTDADLLGAIEDCPARAMLIADIAAQAALFAGAAKSEWVDVRLEAIHNNACWKFHRDFVSLRLLTTYRGPGTEWVLPSHREAALEQQRKYKGSLEKAPAGAVLLFRNDLDEGEGIVHRSPPVARSKQSRLLLCLSPRGPWSPDPWQR